MKTFFFFFLESTCALCPWSLALASSIPVLGLESVCPRKGCPWPWPRIFFVSLALASSLVSSTPPLTITAWNYLNVLGAWELSSDKQGWQYGTVRSEFAYYVPPTLNRTVLTSRTRTITKKAYHTSVPYFLAKIEAYRTVPTYHTVLPSLQWRIQKICWGDDKIYKHKLYIITNLNGDDFCS